MMLTRVGFEPTPFRTTESRRMLLRVHLNVAP